MLLSGRMRRLLLAALAAALVAPVRAEAAAPVMPLSEVEAGVRCTGLTVVRGTDVSSFDVDVLDVVGAGRTARILVRVSGAAVDATGVGPGFSGSPVLCPGADGTARTIGAISESIGEYGGRTVLVTPIATMLAQPAQPPPALPSVPGARTLTAPLTIAGLSPSLAESFTRAARRAGRVLISSPAGPRAPVAPRPLVPGSAVAVGMTSGAISISELGTVSYVDGSDVWMFGHAIEGARGGGRRSLFLLDAFIHTVINNPVAAPDLTTYKLGSPANDIGTITSDGPAAVVGRVGAPPPGFPLRVTARDLSTGRVTNSLTRIADEGDVGRPAGISPLGLAGAAAVAETAASALPGVPARQSGDMCVRVTLRELRPPLRFCNAYAVDGEVPNAFAGAAAADMSAAVGLLEGYRFGALHPVAVDVALRIRPGVSLAFITGATAPRRVRRGRTLRVRLHLRHTGTGARSTRTIRVRVPLDTPRGPRTLRLAGTPADIGGDPDDPNDLSIVFEDEDNGDNPGPQSVEELRTAFAGLARDDGVTATLGDSKRQVYRDPRVRITGRARVPVLVRP